MNAPSGAFANTVASAKHSDGNSRLEVLQRGELGLSAKESPGMDAIIWGQQVGRGVERRESV